MSRAPSAAGALTVLHGHGGPRDGKSLRTLYDLLGASPDDDVESLKNAFRNAVKANHPDLHPHDPGAALRLSGIVRAYAILRDAQERASYDFVLRVSEPARPAPKRTFVGRMGYVLTEAIAVTTMAVVLGGGYALFANVLAQMSSDRKEAELAGRPEHAAVEPAGRAAAHAGSRSDAPGGKPAVVATPSIVSAPAAAVKSGEAMKVVGLVPMLPEREIEAAEGLGAASDQLKVETAELRTNPNVDRPDQDQHPEAGPNAPAPAPVALSSLENNNNMLKPPAPDIAIPDQKDRPKPFLRSSDAKPSELMPHEKLRPAATRPPTGHASVKQASLEGRSASPPCAQSCPGSAPPLLGIGF